MDAPDPVRADDVWHIGSDAKAMTATLVARLVEAGAFSWSTPLSKLLPELVADMQPAYHDVDLKDLFEHRAGLKDLIDSDFLEGLYRDRRPIHEQRLAYLRMALAQPPAYSPRTAFLYSNRGPLIAAVAAERATGRTWEHLIAEKVFQPLGMRSAGFGPTHRGQPLGHDGLEPVEGAKADDPAVIAPAGEVHLSLADWARFAIDQMAGEKGRGRLLKAETYRYLHTAHDGDVYGIGWGVRSAVDGLNGRFLTHAGSNGYWYARIVLVPDRESGLLITANTGPERAAKPVGEVEAMLLQTLV